MKKFVFVGKLAASPFYDAVVSGVADAADTLQVGWQFVGPEKYSEEQQAQLFSYHAARCEGIAVAGSPSPTLADAMRRARRSGLPVITFDADVPADSVDARAAFVGSDNCLIGTKLAHLLMKLSPEGGLIAIHGGVRGVRNHSERLAGFRLALAADAPSHRYREIDSECLFMNGGDHLSAVRAMEQALAGHPEIQAFVAVGPFAQWEDVAYRAAVKPHLDRLDSGNLVLLHGDCVPIQLAQLRDGYSSGQVGQNPESIGSQSLTVLWKLGSSRRPAADVTTGLKLFWRTLDGQLQCENIESEKVH